MPNKEKHQSEIGHLTEAKQTESVIFYIKSLKDFVS
jgi:hypothetical protein